MEDKKKKFFLQTVMIKVDEDSEDVSMGGDDEDDEMEDSSGEISIEQIYVERGSSDSGREFFSPFQISPLGEIFYPTMSSPHFELGPIFKFFNGK